MWETIKGLFKHTHLTVIVCGLLMVVIASLDAMPGSGNEPIPIRDDSRSVLIAVGILAFIVGVAGWWLKMRSESSQPLLTQSPPKGEPTETIKCNGELVDSYLGDFEQIVEMPKERRWKYSLSHIEIKIYQHVLSLEFEALIDSPHNPDVHEAYKCFGLGPFKRGVGFLTYSFSEVDQGSASWKGLMVLQIPSRGIINGFWVTTHVNKGEKFAIGTIVLTRK